MLVLPRPTRTVLFALFLTVPFILPMEALAQSSAVGVWNIRSRDMTDRATGGIRSVLLRIQNAGNGLAGEMTAVSNRFLPVEQMRVEGKSIHVVFGSYEYNLETEGEEISGTVESPFGIQQVFGLRQYRGVMYVGDVSEEFQTTRPGVIGLSSGIEPPTGVNPTSWVREQISSVDDLALIVGSRARVPVAFTNAREFKDELLANVGRNVSMLAVWVSDQLQILSIDPS